MIDFSKLETHEEYMGGVFDLLMGNEKCPQFGYRPIDIKERVEDLLLKEIQLKELKSNMK